jgi:hypothetical protein
VVRILEGQEKDETIFGIIFGIDEGDRWDDPKNLQKANPNYGVSVFPDDIGRLAHKAAQLASAQNNFLTKRLNVWCQTDSAWLDMRDWDACADPDLTLDQFAGEPCWIGIDLASRVDLASMAIVFRRGGLWHLFCRSWLPEDTVDASANAQYHGWARTGRIRITEGSVIDYEQIETELQQLSERFEVKSVAYDPFQAEQFSQRMMAAGFPMVRLGATVANFSQPMKELHGLVADHRLRHDGDPVLGWAVFLAGMTIVLYQLKEKANIQLLSLAFGMVSYTYGALLAIFLLALWRIPARLGGLWLGLVLSILMTTWVRGDVFVVLGGMEAFKGLLAWYQTVKLPMTYAWLYPINFAITFACGCLWRHAPGQTVGEKP